MGKNTIISPKILVLLLVGESFFLTYITFNSLNLIWVLICFGIIVGATVLLVKVVGLYGEHIKIPPDLDDKKNFTRFRKQLFGHRESRGIHQNENWTKGAPIWGLFIVRLVLAYVFVSLDLPLIFLFIFVGFLELIDSRLITLAGENIWQILNYGVVIAVSIIVIMQHLDIFWVKVSIVLYAILFFVIFFDLDLVRLESFIPNAIAILWVYGDPVYGVWVLPVALASFIYELYYSVLVF